MGIKTKIVLLWLIPSIIVSALVTAISWQFAFEPGDTIYEPLPAILLMPIGWIFSLFTPVSWISFIGLGLSLYTKKYLYLVLSWICAIVFGFFWPYAFVTLMSV